MSVNDNFDSDVAALLASGITPKHKPFRAKKSDCSPEVWAAHLAWQRAYSSAPVQKAARKKYEARWLAKRASR